MKSIMPPSMYNSLREMIVFRPEHYTNLIQVLPQKKQGLDDVVPHIKGFRYPAPGSTHKVSVPVRDDLDKVYDIRAYPRNSSNMAFDTETVINATTPAVSRPNGQYGDRTYGSTGIYAKPAVTQYDPSGLRASMNATWEEMDKALEVEAKADHLPMAEWENELESIDAECERKGIPYVAGRHYTHNLSRPKNYTEVKW
jgi:hypothetical protein